MRGCLPAYLCHCHFDWLATPGRLDACCFLAVLTHWRAGSITRYELLTSMLIAVSTSSIVLFDISACTSIRLVSLACRATRGLYPGEKKDNVVDSVINCTGFGFGWRLF